MGRLPTQGVATETAAFVDFLYELRGLSHGEVGNTEFTGQAIRCKVIMVARPDVYALKGSGPYRKAVEVSMSNGFRSIYLLARGRHTEYAEEVAASFTNDPRVLGIARASSRVTTAVGLPLDRAVTRIDVDVRLYTGIGQRPILAVGPGMPGDRTTNHRSRGATRARRH